MLVALQKSEGDFMTLFASPICKILWVALVLSLVLPAFMQHRQRKAQAETAFSEGEG